MAFQQSRSWGDTHAAETGTSLSGAVDAQDKAADSAKGKTEGCSREAPGPGLEERADV